MAVNSVRTATVLISLLLAGLLVACAPAAAPASQPEAPAAEQPAAEATEAPAPEPAAAKVLTYLLIQEPNSMDPAIITESQSGLPIRNVYDRLVELNPDGQTIEPGLAETWDISDDGLTYTFHLRQGVHFHSGTPFTAEAVHYTYERVLTLGKGESFPLTEYLVPENVQALDDHTVELTLNQPYGPVLSLLAQYSIGSIVNPAFIQPHVTDDDPWGEQFLTNHMDGTGPFRFVEWQPKQFVAIERNDDYWRGPAKLDRILFRLVEEPSTSRLMLERGEADIVHNLPTDMIAALRQSPDVRIVETPGLETTYWAFNAETEPFDDVQVREALSYAVDYQAIMDNIVQAGGIRMAAPIPQGMVGYDDTIQPIQRDLEKARALLAEAGYPDGFSTVTHYPVWRDLADIAVVLQANFADVGVNLELQEVTLGTLVDLVVSGETPFFPWVSTPSWADPDAVMYIKFYAENVKYGAGGNISRYSNPEVDPLLEQAQATTDQAERIALYQQAQQMVVADAPWLFLFQSVTLQPLRTWVTGYEFPVIGVASLWNVDVEK